MKRKQERCGNAGKINQLATDAKRQRCKGQVLSTVLIRGSKKRGW